MLPYIIVKHTLLVPVRFLLVALVVLVLVTLLAGAVEHGRGGAGLGDTATTSFVLSLGYVLPVTFPASVLAAILIDLFVILRRPGKPALSLFLLFFTAGLFQYGGTLLIDSDSTARERGVFPSQTLLENREYLFGFRERQGDGMEGVLLISPQEEPAMSVHPEGFLDLNGERLILPEAGMTLPLPPEYSPYAALFGAPPEASGLVQDMERYAADLHRRLESGHLAYLSALLSGTLLFVSFWTLARSTSWKFFNLVLVLLAARLFFLLYHLLNSELIADLVGGYLPVLPSEHILSIGVSIPALLLFVTALLMPPIREWKRGVGDA